MKRPCSGKGVLFDTNHQHYYQHHLDSLVPQQNPPVVGQKSVRIVCRKKPNDNDKDDDNVEDCYSDDSDIDSSVSSFSCHSEEEDAKELAKECSKLEEERAKLFNKYCAVKTKKNKILEIVQRAGLTPLCFECKKPTLSSRNVACISCTLDLPCLEWCSEKRTICGSSVHDHEQRIPNICKVCSKKCKDCHGDTCKKCIKTCQFCRCIVCVDCVVEVKREARVIDVLLENVSSTPNRGGDDDDDDVHRHHMEEHEHKTIAKEVVINDTSAYSVSSVISRLSPIHFISNHDEEQEEQQRQKQITDLPDKSSSLLSKTFLCKRCSAYRQGWDI